MSAYTLPPRPWTLYKGIDSRTSEAHMVKDADGNLILQRRGPMTEKQLIALIELVNGHRLISWTAADTTVPAEIGQR